MFKSAEQELVREACERVEGKCLERGSFSEYFAGDFELSILPIHVDGSKDRFSVQIVINTQDESYIDDESAEALSDMVEDEFFSLLPQFLGKQIDSIVDRYDGKRFILNGNILY